jgi:hypothetical protein
MVMPNGSLWRKDDGYFSNDERFGRICCLYLLRIYMDAAICVDSEI